MTRILFLDDEASRYHALLGTPSAKIVTWVKTAAEAILELGSKPFDLILLDHDLRDEHYREDHALGTGEDVARWIAEEPARIGDARVYVHSVNAPGAARMVAVLRDAGVSTAHVPFMWTKV